MFYRSRFMAHTKEFREEPDCGHPLGLSVEIEAKTKEVMNIANARAKEIASEFQKVKAQLGAIENAMRTGDSNLQDSDLESEDENLSEYAGDDDRYTDEDEEPYDDRDEEDYDNTPNPVSQRRPAHQ
jgi:hypothetical protein